jgi:hypothetical protein
MGCEIRTSEAKRAYRCRHRRLLSEHLLSYSQDFSLIEKLSVCFKKKFSDMLPFFTPSISLCIICFLLKQVQFLKKPHTEMIELAVSSTKTEKILIYPGQFYYIIYIDDCKYYRWAIGIYGHLFGWWV